MKPPGRLALLVLALVLLLAACAPSRVQREPEEGGAADLEVYFFDAGKADAILLTTDNSAVLIDAGEKGFGQTILDYLEEKGVEKLDYLILTHFDQDHVGGAAKVINNIEVGAVLQSNHPKDSQEYEKYVKALSNAKLEPLTVRETYAFTLDGVEYRVDPPRQSQYTSDDSNNSSLMTAVRNGENRFLFTGDAQTERLEEFLETNKTTFQVLKVPHHGKEEPLLPELLSSVKPDWAVITSSQADPESLLVLQALEEAGVQVLLTRDGPVCLHSDGVQVRKE